MIVIQISGFGSDDFELVTSPSSPCSPPSSALLAVQRAPMCASWTSSGITCQLSSMLATSSLNLTLSTGPHCTRAKYGRRASSCLFAEICDSRTVHCSCCMPCSTEKRRKNLSNLSTYQAGRRVACLGRFHSACGSISTFRAPS
jgi:hypothetical protein